MANRRNIPKQTICVVSTGNTQATVSQQQLQTHLMAFNRTTITVTRAQVFTILDALEGAQYGDNWPETQECASKLCARLNKLINKSEFIGALPDNK